jgi:hypothetical protein
VDSATSSLAYSTRCTACGRDLSGLVSLARFCPHCGTRLGPDVSFSNCILRGYANAMFRLGVHHEVRHNDPEALRCYDKASRLGNPAALCRMKNFPPQTTQEAHGTDIA